MRYLSGKVLSRVAYLIVALVLPIALIANVPLAQAGAVRKPMMTDLGTLSGDDTSVALGVNSSSTVVGYSENSTSEATRAFYWQPSATGSTITTAGSNAPVSSGALGTMTDLSTLVTNPTVCPTGCNSEATAINATGTIVGYDDYVTGGVTTYVGFIDNAGAVTFVNDFEPSSINSNGLVVGIDTSASGSAAEWVSGDISAFDLPSVTGETVSSALGVNDSGVVVGNYNLNGVQEAVAWVTPNKLTPTGVVDLGDLNLGGGGASATAINNSDQVVGYSKTPSTTTDSFGVRISATGKAIVPTVLPMTASNDIGANSAASAITTKGEIAGVTQANTSTPIASTWLNYASAPSAAVGVISGGSLSAAYGVNLLGDVVGYGDFSGASSGQTHAFFWNPKGEIVTKAVKGAVTSDLGTLPGGSTSQATGINDSGQVVGFSDTTQGNQYSSSHPFLWNSINGMTDLYSTGFVQIGCGAFGACTAEAVGINSNGTVVGWWYNSLFGSAGQRSGFIYNGSSVTNIPNFVPTAVNASGVISGQDDKSGTPTAAEYVSGTGVVDLSTSLSNVSLTDPNFTATGINDSGEIVGSYNDTNNIQEALVWPTPTTPLSLGNIPGGSFTYATAISYKGVVVGYGTVGGQHDSFSATFNAKTKTVSMIDTGLGSNGSEALAIGLKGQATGFANQAINQQISAIWANGAVSPTILTPISGGTYSVGTGINDIQEVSGYGDFPGSTNSETHAFLWAPKAITVEVTTII